ncbi:hypothetical protein V6R21_02560 [Limibacter armeniacum]|uniref:hypothetical protein n=1 Tax=Limibacter armeniacum TaxID=466084 RepID=UPI002FE6355F
MITKQIALLSLLLIVSAITMAQPVVGFWKVDLVMVGDMDVTPVAKWFKYHQDHSYQAGNGWSQNSVGTWTYDKQKEEFLPFNSKGEPDEFGAFKTSFEDGKMYWEREEEGMKVKVTLSPTTEMPMAPKDSIAGKWQLVSIIKEGKDITDLHKANHQEEIFIRWGGTYIKTNPDGSKSHGFWHMDPHHPKFHMVDWNKEVDFMAFNISFDHDLVKMVPWKDKEITYTYKRK